MILFSLFAHICVFAQGFDLVMGIFISVSYAKPYKSNSEDKLNFIRYRMKLCNELIDKICILINKFTIFH